MPKNKPHDANEVIQEFVEYFSNHPEYNGSTVMLVHDYDPPLEVKIWSGMKYYELREEFLKAQRGRDFERMKQSIAKYIKEQPHDKG